MFKLRWRLKFRFMNRLWWRFRCRLKGRLMFKVRWRLRLNIWWRVMWRLRRRRKMIAVIIVKFWIVTLKKTEIGQNPWTLRHLHRLVDPHIRLVKKICMVIILQLQQILIFLMKMDILIS